jgi:hypothetical protein
MPLFPIDALATANGTYGGTPIDALFPHRCPLLVDGIYDAARMGSGSRRISLREFPPGVLRPPPDYLAAEDNHHAKHNPCVKARGDDAQAECKHGNHHRQVIRARESTMRASASPGVEKACRPHPGQRDQPNGCAGRHVNQQSENKRRVRKPPGQYVGTGIAQPISRGKNSGACRDRSPRAAASIAAFTITLRLHRRARHRAVRAKHATVARLRA